MVNFPMSGYIAAELGWEAAFYIEGGLAVAAVLLWLLLVYESPAQHPRISTQERLFIEATADGRPQMQSPTRQSAPPVPWRAILTSVPFWALVITTLGNNWGYYFLLTGLPIYLKTMLHFDIKSVPILRYEFSTTFLFRIWLRKNYENFAMNSISCQALFKLNQ